MAHQTGRHALDQLPPHHRSSSDYVHLRLSADVATLSNYSYYYPGWNEQDMTLNGSETLRRTKRVSFRLEPSSDTDNNIKHNQHVTEDLKFQTGYYNNNNIDIHLENQSKNSKGLSCGEAVIFDLDLQKLNDVIV